MQRSVVCVCWPCGCRWVSPRHKQQVYRVFLPKKHKISRRCEFPPTRYFGMCGPRIAKISCYVVVLTLTRKTSVVAGQAPVTLELRNTPGKNTHNPRWYTHISQLTQFMPPPETYKSKIGSQSTMCQVQTGAYVSLLTP